MSLEIKRSDLNALIHKAVEKQEAKLTLESKKNELLSQIKQLNEENVGQPAVAGQPAPNTNIPAPNSPITPTATSNEKQESIFDAKPGETIIFNFQDVTIKVQRQLDDLFKVTDASESKKLKDGDYIKIQGNDTLASGKKFKFVILRQALNYESNPLASW